MSRVNAFVHREYVVVSSRPREQSPIYIRGDDLPSNPHFRAFSRVYGSNEPYGLTVHVNVITGERVVQRVMPTSPEELTGHI